MPLAKAGCCDYVTQTDIAMEVTENKRPSKRPRLSEETQSREVTASPSIVDDHTDDEDEPALAQTQQVKASDLYLDTVNT